MKILLIADTHVGVRNDSPTFLNNFKKSCDEFLFPFIKENNIQEIIHLGDLVDRRKYINIATADFLAKTFLDPLEQMNVNFKLIAGNHDEYYKNSNLVNSLELLLQRRKLQFFINPVEIIYDEQPYLFLPWICDENYQQSMDALNTTRSQIVFGHLEIAGFEMHRGSISEHGMDRNIFNKFDQVYSGHYHHKSSDGIIDYIGAFSEYIWSDYNDARGFSVFDTDTRDITFIENPFTVHKKIFYDDTKEILNIPDVTEIRNKHIKLIIINKNNPNTYDIFLDSLSVEAAEIQVVEDHHNHDIDDEDHIIDEAESVDVILEKYIDNIKFNNIDTSQFKLFMNTLYKEASESE